MKLLVVDDQPLCRAGLRSILSQLGKKTQVLEAETCDEALHMANTHIDIDLILLDLGLLGVNGFSVLRTLHQGCPNHPIAVMSTSEEAGDVLTAINAGAVGYIPKSSSSEVMLSALRLIFAGGVYLPLASLPRSVMSNDLSGKPETSRSRQTNQYIGVATEDYAHGLTKRQLTVLSMLVQGSSNKTIARTLSLTEGTVKNHLASIYKTLRVSNRTQALIAAKKMGLVADP